MKIIKHILTLLNWLAALLLVLSTLAGVVRPSRCYWLSLLSYAYFPLLLTNAALAVLWLCLSRREFLISFVAIVVRWSFVPLFFQVGGASAAPGPEANTIKVMSFNMHHFYGRNYVSQKDCMGNQDSNAVTFLGMLRDEAPDVLCLQEFLPYTANMDVRDSMKAMGYEYYAAAAPRYGHSASIFWSKYPIVNTLCIDSVRKVQADIVKQGDTIRIFSFHLSSFQLTEDNLEEIDKISRGEVEDMIPRSTLGKFKANILAHDSEWVELKPYIENSPYPCIVAGDFNDTPASYIYQQMAKTLKDTYKERGKGFCTTYHGRFPAFRIDYILHSSDFKALSYKRLKSDMSDHYPILAELEL